jgi:hypothetical protein
VVEPVGPFPKAAQRALSLPTSDEIRRLIEDEVK